MEKKICKKCNQELPLEEFYISPSMKYNRDNTCKNCRRTEKGRERTPNILYCPVCNKDLPYYKFDIANKSTTGRMWCCKECFNNKPNISSNNFRRKYDSYFRDKIDLQRRESRLRYFIHDMWVKAKSRAIKRNLDFNIEESDIIIPEFCPILEHKLEFGTKDNYDWSPSLDRIDNTKGYIKGNIQVISKKANTMKSSATLEELQIFCKNILRYSPNYTENEGIESKDKEP